ncbi:MAG: NADH-quinone oxidoreductase subunit N [Deltaproteobacteria bacterium]|nr:NADH-quinone oxidoreductase subunit N [Deltaproteobacteria bacterium]
MLHDLVLTTPLLILLFAALFTLVVDAFLPSGDDNRRFWAYFGAAASAASVLASVGLWKFGGSLEMHTTAFAQHLSMSHYSLFFVALTGVCALVTHLASPKYLSEHGSAWGEYYALLNFAAFGMGAMVASESLLTLFVGLEIMSMAIYVMVAIKRTSQASVEAGMKYFIMGSVASAFLLYGMAFLYGLSGGTSYLDISRALSQPGGNTLWLSLAVLLTSAAFLFKVAAVPFHMWTPDAYEGAPTPVTGLMSSAVKAAGFAALLKFLYACLGGPAMNTLHAQVPVVLATIAVITMTVGNLLALSQKSAKRTLAYSSIAHAGYLLLGCVAVVADPNLPGYLQPTGAVPFYLVGYAFASLAGFAALTVVGKGGEERTGEEQLIGMGRNYPFAGAVLALAMISLAGVPPTLGFFGKLQLARDVLGVDGGKYLPHIIILVLNSVVSAYYYLRITVWVYMRPDPKQAPEYIRETSLTWAMGLAAAGILLVGILPQRALVAGQRGVATIRTATAIKALRYEQAKPGPQPVRQAAAQPPAPEAKPAAEN